MNPNNNPIKSAKPQLEPRSDTSLLTAASSAAAAGVSALATLVIRGLFNESATDENEKKISLTQKILSKAKAGAAPIISTMIELNNIKLGLTREDPKFIKIPPGYRFK